MKIREIAFYVLLGLATVAVGVGIISCSVKMDNKIYNNALQYAKEHDCRCLGDKGSLVFVFSNGDIIGRDVVLNLYK